MPTLSTSNLSKIGFIQETSFGTIPVTGNGNALRFTGESIAAAIPTETSKEIRADRLTADLIQVGASVSGGVNFELSYKEYNPIMQGVLAGTWAYFGTNGVSSATFSATINSSTGTITAASAPTGSDAFTTLAVGQWFRLTAPGDAADGAFLKVGSTSTTVITCDALTPVPGTGTRAAVLLSKVSAARLTNGIVNRTFTTEVGFTDINQYFAFTGCGFSKLSVDITAGALITGSFDVMGKFSSRATSTQLPGSTVASQTFDIMNGVFGVGTIYEGGAALTGTYCKSIKFDIDGKLRAVEAIGVLGAAQLNQGTLSISGEMDLYLADGTIYDKFINQTASSIAFPIKDKANNGYVITFPKVKYKDAKVVASGLDQDTMITVPFEALYDPTTGKAVIIDSLGAAGA